MISDRELWACAQQVIEQHGDRAPMFVAERIGALAIEGDKVGVVTWMMIAARVEQLTELRKDGAGRRQ